MTSSTSSSEHASLPLSNGRAGLLMILIALLVLGPAVLFVRGFTGLAEKSGGDVFGIQRIRSVHAQMDYMAQQAGPTVLVFGSSLTNEGFSPRHFDRQAEAMLGTDITSFNIGMGNMKPSYQLLLAKRLREAHERAGRKAALSIIELTPFLLTEKRNAFRPFMTEQVTAVLMSREELMQELWRDPERFARLFTIKYLRDGISAEAITGGLRFLIGSAQSQVPLIASLGQDQIALITEQRRLQGELNRQIGQQHPDTRKSIVWNPATQGGLIDMEDLSADTQDLARQLVRMMRDPGTLQRDARDREECCDIRHLVFDASMVDEFVAIVEEFKQFSERVEIVLMPTNHTLIGPTPDALARQQQVLQQIAARTGVPLLDYQQHPQFAADDFYDATHLSLDSGKPRFSALLARDLADELVSVIGANGKTVAGKTVVTGSENGGG